MAAERDALSQQVARLQQAAEEAARLGSKQQLGQEQAAEGGGSSAPLIKAVHGPGMISVEAAELAELQGQVVELRDALQVGGRAAGAAGLLGLRSLLGLPVMVMVGLLMVLLVVPLVCLCGAVLAVH